MNKSSNEKALDEVVDHLLNAQADLGDLDEDYFAHQVIVDIHWAITDTIDLIKSAIKADRMRGIV